MDSVILFIIGIIGFDLIKDINYIYNGKSLYLDVFGDNKNSDKSNVINIRAKETTLYNNNIHMGYLAGDAAQKCRHRLAKSIAHLLSLPYSPAVEH